jgi:hypothetical protein
MTAADMLRSAVAAHRAGQRQDAKRAYDQILAADPGNGWANYFRSVLADEAGEPALALACLRRAAQAPDPPVQSLVALGNRELAEREFEAALAAFTRAQELRPLMAAAMVGKSLALKRMGRFEGALAASRRALFLRRSWKVGLPKPPGELDPADIEQMRRTNRVKLRHDAAQIRHLHRQGTLNSDYLQIARAYENLAADLRHLPQDTTITVLDDAALASTKFAYNRLLHLPESGRVAGDALAADTDFSLADARYADTRPAPVVIDNALSPDALSGLQRLCRNATIWFEVKDHGGHIGAYFEEGLGCDLLVQIAEGLRRRLPRSLSHLRLAQLWAYKHVQGGSGTDYHADIGQVSANLWITADDASLDKDGGGLEIWPLEMPAEWDFRKANIDRAGIRSLLATSPVQPINIPHRCNRLVLFDANSFHRTSPGRFAEGYLKQRVNITFLYDRPM